MRSEDVNLYYLVFLPSGLLRDYALLPPTCLSLLPLSTTAQSRLPCPVTPALSLLLTPDLDLRYRDGPTSAVITRHPLNTTLKAYIFINQTAYIKPESIQSTLQLFPFTCLWPSVCTSCSLRWIFLKCANL